LLSTIDLLHRNLYIFSGIFSAYSSTIYYKVVYDHIYKQLHYKPIEIGKQESVQLWPFFCTHANNYRGPLSTLLDITN